MRTRSGRQAEDGRGVVAVHVRRLGAGADHQGVAVEPGGAGLGLDGACSTKGVSIVAAATCGAGRERGGGVAAADAAAGQAVVGALAVDGGASAASAAAGSRGREAGSSGRGSRRGRRSGSSRATRATGSPRKRVSVSASAGWSAKRGMTPKRLRPGMSSAVRTAATPGRAAAQAARSPKAKPARGCGERIARERQGVGGHGVGAEALGAVDLGAAVEARQPGADRGAGGRRRSGSGGGAGVEDRGDDPAVAGAAAEDAAEGVGDLAPRSGAGVRARSAVAASSMPGVQAPHCAAPWRRKADCRRGEGGAGEALDGGDACGRRRGRQGSGRRRPGRRRGARCRRRSRRRRSRPWCR